ncbi:hypothetical protein [Brevundimonas sp. SL161]|uniref:hypothetical protein n=1 Tax=Brevundimonas sp. SL161 TaxID=2804613 RepID=UPI003CEBA306
MQNYAVSTWAGDRLVGHEPLVAESITEVRAFVQGMITERVRDHKSMLAQFGIRYVIEHGHRTLEELTTHSPANQIGTWHVVDKPAGTSLIWQPNERYDS